jgi:hypothetical protein
VRRGDSRRDTQNKDFIFSKGKVGVELEVGGAMGEHGE